MNAMEKGDNKCDCIHGLILLYFVYLHGFQILIINENSIKEIADSKLKQDGVTQINSKQGSLKCPFIWLLLDILTLYIKGSL